MYLAAQATCPAGREMKVPVSLVLGWLAWLWHGSQTPWGFPILGEAEQWPGASGAQPGLCKYNSNNYPQLGSFAAPCQWSLSGAIPWPQSCSVFGEQEPLKQRWETCSYFFRHMFSSCPFFRLIRSPRAFASHRLGSLPATFLQVDVAFLSSLILITLEFMNHSYPKL